MFWFVNNSYLPTFCKTGHNAGVMAALFSFGAAVNRQRYFHSLFKVSDTIMDTIQTERDLFVKY